MTWIKLCGMTRRRDVEAAVAVGADAVGFVVAPESKRQITVGMAADLGRGIDIARYLVSVDLSPEVLLEAAERGGVDGVQPHGEHAEAAARAALDAGLKVLFPIPVGSGVDLSHVPRDATPLLDTAVAGIHGGSGITFDWGLAADLGRDLVVAGGLNPGNVAEAVEMSAAWGVDVASGIESSPGEKDAEAMRRFVEALR